MDGSALDLGRCLIASGYDDHLRAQRSLFGEAAQAASATSTASLHSSSGSRVVRLYSAPASEGYACVTLSTRFCFQILARWLYESPPLPGLLALSFNDFRLCVKHDGLAIHRFILHPLEIVSGLAGKFMFKGFLRQIIINEPSVASPNNA